MRGDGRIFLRGTTYWASYYLRGKEFRESTGETEPDRAAKFLRNRLKEVHADDIGATTFITPQQRRLTVHDLLETLKAKFEMNGQDSAQNLSHLKKADEDFGHYLAMGLTPEHVDKYKTDRLGKHDKPATINRPLQMVRQAYRLAAKRGKVARVPSIELLSEEGNARRGFLEPAQFRNLLAALPDDGLRDFCEWAYITGQRKSEIAQLRWSMIEGTELRIPGDICKNGRPRTIPLSSDLAAIVERRKGARRIEDNGTARIVEFIFHRDGKQVREFRKSWATARKTAKVSALFHDLRRSSIRNAIQAGVIPQVAKKLSGHISDAVFARYNILTTDDLRVALEKTKEYREKEATKRKVVAMR
jgi:integrase